MGSSHDHNGASGDLHLVTVNTNILKDKLNRMYDAMRGRPRLGSNAGLFEYLWDLKELALLEGRQSVQVPTSWLQELEEDCGRIPVDRSPGH